MYRTEQRKEDTVMKYAHLSDAELIRYIDNLPSATSLERVLAERLNALHERAVKETESGKALPRSAL
jgi:hypothetical protein